MQTQATGRARGRARVWGGRVSGVVAAAGMALAAGGAAGGPIEVEHVPEDAAWAAHVDLAWAAETEIGAWALEMIDAETDGYAEIREGLPGFTLSPEGGIHGVTVFGHSMDEGDERFVALIYGDERIGSWGAHIDRIFAEFGVEDASFEVRGTEVWTIPIEDDESEVFAGMLRRGEERLWLVAPEVEDLADAISTIKRGTGGHEGLASLGWREGTIAMVGMQDPGEYGDWDDMSHVIEQADAVVARMGESDGHVFAEAWVETGAPEEADNIARVLNGLLALGVLMQGDDPSMERLMQMARGLEVESDDGRVAVSFEAEVGAFAELLEEMDAHGGWDEDEDDVWHELDEDDDGPSETGWEGSR